MIFLRCVCLVISVSLSAVCFGGDEARWEEDTNPWSLQVNHMEARNGYYPAREGIDLTLHLLPSDHYDWSEDQDNKGHRITVTDSTGKKMKDVGVSCRPYTSGENVLMRCSVYCLETPSEGAEWIDVEGMLNVNVREGKVDLPLSRRLTMGSNISRKTMRLLPKEERQGGKPNVSSLSEENDAPYTDLPVAVKPVGWSVDDREGFATTKLLFNMVPPEGFWFVKNPMSFGGEGEIHVSDSKGKNLGRFDVDFGIPKEGFFSILSSPGKKIGMRSEVLCYARGHIMPSPGSKWLKGTGYVCLPIASEKLYSQTFTLDIAKDSSVNANGITVKVENAAKSDDSMFAFNLIIDPGDKPSQQELVFLDAYGNHDESSGRTIDIADKKVSLRMKMREQVMKFCLVTYKDYQMLKIPVVVKIGMGRDEGELKK